MRIVTQQGRWTKRMHSVLYEYVRQVSTRQLDVPLPMTESHSDPNLTSLDFVSLSTKINLTSFLLLEHCARSLKCV